MIYSPCKDCPRKYLPKDKYIKECILHTTDVYNIPIVISSFKFLPYYLSCLINN